MQKAYTSEVYSLVLDKQSTTPLYIQLADLIISLIESKVLKPEEKLPPIRKLSKHFELSTITIINAYKYLENKKYIYSLGGNGSFVSKLKHNEDNISFNEDFTNTNIFNKENSSQNEFLDFSAGSIDMGFFPVSEFKDYFNTILDRDKAEAFSYQDPYGYYPLREALVNYSLQFSIKTTAENIQIISGAQQGLDIISKILLTANDYVFVEKPTFQGACFAFSSRGANIIEIPIYSDGLDVEELEELVKLYKPKLIYIMPYFQTPTGVSYSLEKKNFILKLANKYNFYIVEEDNQSEYNFFLDKIMPIKAMDYNNKVVYIKSFSKILMPGLRMGFMIIPSKILNKARLVKYNTDISSSGFIQRTFDLYLRSNEWVSYKNKMHKIFKTRYNITKKSIDTYLLDYITYSPPDGGLSFWVSLNNANSDTLCKSLLNYNILITSGEVFSSCSDFNNHFRLSFSNIQNHKIDNAIKTISEVLKS